MEVLGFWWELYQWIFGDPDYPVGNPKTGGIVPRR